MLSISFFLLLQAAGAGAQDPKLKDRVDDQEDRLKDLEKKLQDLEKKQSATTSANPFTVLNPTLTVAGDFLARFDDRKVYLDNDPAEPRIDDTLNLREAEIDLRASVDPFVDGVAIISIESEVPGTYDATVEEFFATIKSLPLPLWESPPLGTKIKVGRFRTEFGLNNKSHTHDLPQSDRPLVIREFLGEEGMAANGISTQSFLPSPGDTALELTLQLLQGGESNLSQDGNHLAYLGNLNLFLPLADEHSLNLALIGFAGTNDPDDRDRSRCASAEVLYKWKPLRQGEYSSFLLGAQVFAAVHEDPAGPPDSRSRPLGYDVWAQCQVSSRLYAGIRWDFTETLADDDVQRKQLSPYLTWYSSEFFRARFTYQHTWSDLAIEDRLDSFMLELVIVFGAHPPEPFWVNR